LDLVRVLRVIEYVGPRDVVEQTINASAIRGNYCAGRLMMREAVLGEYPEVLGVAPDESDQDTPGGRPDVSRPGSPRYSK